MAYVIAQPYLNVKDGSKGYVLCIEQAASIPRQGFEHR